MPLTPYTLKHVPRQACTMLLPTPHVQRMRLISLRTGIPSNALAALAVDEYLSRHYPDSGGSDAVTDEKAPDAETDQQAANCRRDAEE